MCRRTLCTLFATLALFAGTTWAQSQIRIVRLSYVEGDVQLDRDGQGFSKAFLNLPIVEGARLSTGTDGYAEAELEDGSAIRLTPNSLVEFPELTRDNTGTQTTVALKQGQVYFIWKQNHDDVLRARVGDQLFTAKKRSHFRLSATDSDSAIAVFDGKLEMFRSNGQRIDVQKNETLSLSFEDMDRYFLTRAITEDPFDAWDHDRESDMQREQAAAQANSYASLTPYGSFLTSTDYGSVWRPTGVGYDWNPYQDGSWVWYPNGYVWVSSYPWGWAPYRYGSWLYVNNIGWCWRPGPFGSTWNTGPVILHPPGGFFPPQPPRHRDDGVIVVGRPPHDFDGDHRWRHPPAIAVAPVHNTGPVANTNPVADPRPGRPTRDAEPTTGNSTGPAVHRGGDARPERVVPAAGTSSTPPSSAVTPVQPRPARSERLPSTSPAPDTHARPYSPPPQSAPTPSQGVAPHYSPPPSPPPAPAQAQPAPRSEPGEGRVPKR